MKPDKNLLGAFAAGVLIGILFAPDKGSSTRKRVAKNGTGLIDSLRYGFYQAQDQVSRVIPKKPQHLEGADT